MKLLRFLLFPFGIIYGVVTGIRNWCFDIGIFKSASFNIPVIAVGNLSVGGTGKTPQIEYLIRLLKNDYQLAVLSRGYKRKTNGFIQLNNSHTAEDVGDEPLQFFKKFGNEITVAVDADRTNGISTLINSNNKPAIVLLDDAFQHRKVKASNYVLLTKYDDLYINDFILPTGNLRESRRGAKRANFIIVTKCPVDLSLKEQCLIIEKIKPLAEQQVFFTTITYSNKLRGAFNISVNDLHFKELVLVTGIANPKPLLEYLKEKKINFKHLKYPDHHHFSKSDIKNIENAFLTITSNEKIILTTEKDFVRLEGKLNSLCYLAIETSFLNNESTKFNQKIKLALRLNK